MKKTPEEIRKEKNKEILERMKNPEDNLTNGLTQEEMFFPKRPVIKKDKQKIKQIFGEKSETKK